MNGGIVSTFVNGFDFTEAEAWIPDILRSRFALASRSRMTDFIPRVADLRRGGLAEAQNKIRHPRPRERPQGAESVGNPCLGLYEARAGGKNRREDTKPK